MEKITNNSKNYELPDRPTVLAHLEDLISERRSREEIASWAEQFICGDYDHIRVKDRPAWEMLSALAGADMRNSPIEYLHCKEDFEDWLMKLKNDTSE